MTIAQADPVRAATPNVSQDDVEAHAYIWYDPDAAAFELGDRLEDLDPLTDEDVVAIPDRG